MRGDKEKELPQAFMFAAIARCQRERHRLPAMVWGARGMFRGGEGVQVAGKVAA